MSSRSLCLPIDGCAETEPASAAAGDDGDQAARQQHEANESRAELQEKLADARRFKEVSICKPRIDKATRELFVHLVLLSLLLNLPQTHSAALSASSIGCISPSGMEPQAGQCSLRSVRVTTGGIQHGSSRAVLRVITSSGCLWRLRVLEFVPRPVLCVGCGCAQSCGSGAECASQRTSSQTGESAAVKILHLPPCSDSQRLSSFTTCPCCSVLIRIVGMLDAFSFSVVHTVTCVATSDPSFTQSLVSRPRI